jgi:hypothetical protein
MIEPTQADEFAIGQLVHEINELIISVKTTVSMLSPGAKDQFQPKLKQLQEDCAALANTLWEETLAEELKRYPKRRRSDR